MDAQAAERAVEAMARQNELRRLLLADAVRAARAEVDHRTCQICCDDFDLSEGVECGGDTGGGGDDEQHFTCDSCFSEFVLAMANEDLKHVKARKGRVFCPSWGHGCRCAAPFRGAVVAQHSSEAAFVAYVLWRAVGINACLWCRCAPSKSRPRPV